MTLVITAVTPTAIIMGADSAIMLPKGVAPGQLYSGFTKVVHWRAAGQGIAAYGNFPLEAPGGTYLEWLATWLDKSGLDRPMLRDILPRLCSGLDTVMKGVSGPCGLHMAGWVTDADGYPGTKMPAAFRIKRDSTGKFTALPQIHRKVADSIYKLRTAGSQEWATQTWADGAPAIEKRMAELRKSFSSIVGKEVPALDSGAMFLYVRTLISLTADLYRLAGASPLVSPPVNMLMLNAEMGNTVQFQF